MNRTWYVTVVDRSSDTDVTEHTRALPCVMRYHGGGLSSAGLSFGFGATGRGGDAACCAEMLARLFTEGAPGVAKNARLAAKMRKEAERLRSVPPPGLDLGFLFGGGASLVMSGGGMAIYTF